MFQSSESIRVSLRVVCSDLHGSPGAPCEWDDVASGQLAANSCCGHGLRDRGTNATELSYCVAPCRSLASDGTGSADCLLRAARVSSLGIGRGLVSEERTG